ncbi:hypothetical protein OAW18_07130 [Alphaproteobacteria bacterium]|nr:hypothetical protein [Alphaproteobacteria bacterium]
MGIIRKMIETAKLTAEVANNGLRKFGYQSCSKANKAFETVAPAAIKSASDVYERFKSDYGLETQRILK